MSQHGVSQHGVSQHGVSQRGDHTIQVAIGIPVLLLLIAVIFQTAFWFMGQHAATAAAQAGADAAAQLDGTAGAGTATADSVLDQAGFLADRTVTGNLGPDTATVIVTGSTVKLVPGLTLPVRKIAVSARERVTRP